MTSIFSLTAMLLYAGAWIVLLRTLSADGPRDRVGTFDGLLGYLAVMAHGLVLIPAFFQDGYPNLALGSTFSLIALIIAALFLAARLFQPIQGLGVLIFPSAFTGVAFGWLLPGPTYAAKLHGATSLFHLLGAGLAYALLSLSLAQALLLHFHDRDL